MQKSWSQYPSTGGSNDINYFTPGNYQITDRDTLRELSSFLASIEKGLINSNNRYPAEGRRAPSAVDVSDHDQADEWCRVGRDRVRKPPYKDPSIKHQCVAACSPSNPSVTIRLSPKIEVSYEHTGERNHRAQY
ncbi:hypothetical protein VTJ04DRAFT_3513 [Mycothermus thermophilus]|uniref:uncharacterized protein n=1 Tax=Humicola insolens TaxID=85995 RepID=UPI0037437070